MARLSWGSIIAGCVVALSIHLLLTMLGIGLGFRLVNPYTDENPALGFTTAAGVAWTISALISLWVGGWVAGRTSGKGYGNVGGLHGIVVWSVATVLSFTIFSGTIGLLAGGAAVAVGKAGALTVKTAGLAAGATLPSVANQMASDAKNGDQNAAGAGLVLSGFKDTVASFLDEVSPNSANGTASANTNNSAATVTAPASTDGSTNASAFNLPRARREVGEALYRNFTTPNSTNRAALVQSLVDYTGKSPADAEATVKEWEASYNQIKTDIEQAKEKATQEAKDAADRLSKALISIASWTFLMFGVGAFAAAWGGRCGGQRALALHIDVTTTRETNA